MRCLSMSNPPFIVAFVWDRSSSVSLASSATGLNPLVIAPYFFNRYRSGPSFSTAITSALQVLDNFDATMAGPYSASSGHMWSSSFTAIGANTTPFSSHDFVTTTTNQDFPSAVSASSTAIGLLQLWVVEGGKLFHLAEGLLKKHIASHSLHEPKALSVYITLLEQRSKYGKALEILSGPLGSLMMIEVDKLRLQGKLLAKARDYAPAADVFS